MNSFWIVDICHTSCLLVEDFAHIVSVGRGLLHALCLLVEDLPHPVSASKGLVTHGVCW